MIRMPKAAQVACLALGLAWLWAGPARAGMFEAQLGAHFTGEDGMGRETSVSCRLPWNGYARAVNESYDEFLSGEQYRWGLAGGYAFGLAGLDFITAGGMSLSGSRELKDQLSLDLYFRVSYGCVFLEADNLFYQDGLHATHVLALAWPFAIGPTVLSPMLGVGAYLNTDYARALYPLHPFLGVRCAF